MRAEKLGVVVGERPLVSGAEQVLAKDQRALVVEDRGLHGSLQELFGVAAEELVQRVLAGDVHGQAAPAPLDRRAPGATPHLPQRGDGAGKRDDDGGVERADVDAQLERVSRDDGAQLTAHQTALELAPLLGGVAGAVGDDELGQLGVGLGEVVFDEAAEQLDGLARLDEADRACVLAHEAREQLGGLAERGATCADALVGERRVPHGYAALGRG